MERKHQLIYRFQFFMLSILMFVFIFSKGVGSGTALLLLLPLFISEFMLLYCESKIGVQKIRYKKGCFFAMLDLLAVFIFLLYVLAFAVQYFYPFISIYKTGFVCILAYTLIRKIYISRNFSYLK